MRKIGNYILFLLSIAWFGKNIMASSIILRALTQQGTVLYKAATGIPFVIEATLHDVTSQQRPFIKNLDNLHVVNEQLSSSMRTINNQTSYMRRFFIYGYY